MPAAVKTLKDAFDAGYRAGFNGYPRICNYSQPKLHDTWMEAYDKGKKRREAYAIADAMSARREK